MKTNIKANNLLTRYVNGTRKEKFMIRDIILFGTRDNAKALLENVEENYHDYHDYTLIDLELFIAKLI